MCVLMTDFLLNVDAQFEWLLIREVVYVSRGSAIASDAVVLIATWTRSFSQWREAQLLQLPASISTLLLRDGERSGTSGHSLVRFDTVH